MYKVLKTQFMSHTSTATKGAHFMSNLSIAAKGALICAAIPFALPLLAGPISSGGGNAVVCRSDSGAILSAEVLDIYEGRERYGYTMMEASGQFEQDYLLSVRSTYRLQGANDITLGSDTREHLSRFMDIVRFTPPGDRLPLLNDRGDSAKAPQGCAIEQLAIFETFLVNGAENSHVRVDTEIWGALDSLNKAALVTHELMYAHERRLLEKTSEGTRAWVAQVYAQEDEIAPVMSKHPQLDGLGPIAYCSTAIFNNNIPRQTRDAKMSTFYVYPALKKESDGSVTSGTVLQFTHIMGRPLLSRTTAFIPELTPHFATLRDHLSLVDSDELVEFQEEFVLEGAHRDDWKLEVTQSFSPDPQNPAANPTKIKIGLMQDGVLLEEAFISSCFQRRQGTEH